MGRTLFLLIFLLSFATLFESRASNSFTPVNRGAQALRCEGALSSGVRLLKMDPKYKGEDKGTYIDPITKTPWDVQYFSEAMKKAFELKNDRGVLLDAHGRKAESVWDAEGGAYETSLFVMTKDRKFYLMHLDERGKYHHSSLTSGDDVLYAGVLAVDQGVIRFIGDDSGHYKPDALQTLILLRELKLQGLPLSRAKLEGRLVQQITGRNEVLQPEQVQKLLEKMFANGTPSDVDLQILLRSL